MQEFHRDCESISMTKVEVLREAQVSMLQGTIKLTSVNSLRKKR